MAHKPDTSPANPLKDQGQRKLRTKQLGDQAAAGPGRNAPGEADNRRRAETSGGDGSSGGQADKGATSRDAAAGPWAADRLVEASGDRESSSGAASGHPGEHGGVTPLNGSDTQQERATQKPGVKRKGPSPADADSSNRTGTAPDRSGGQTSRRTGRTKGDRQGQRKKTD